MNEWGAGLHLEKKSLSLHKRKEKVCLLFSGDGIGFSERWGARGGRGTGPKRMKKPLTWGRRHED